VLHRVAAVDGHPIRAAQLTGRDVEGWHRLWIGRRQESWQRIYRRLAAGGAPFLLVGADDLEVLVDEDVVWPVDANVVDLVLAVAQLHDTVDDASDRP
jgi:hypothetical protein